MIDWSSFNTLAVALGTSIYLWNADTGAIDQLLELTGVDYVTSLCWVPNGNLLSVGTSLGPVQVCRMCTVVSNKLFVYIEGYCSFNSYGMSIRQSDCV